MNRSRCALFLLLTSAWLSAAGYRALAAQAAQLVPLGPEKGVYTDVSPNPPAMAVQPDGSYVMAWDDDSTHFEGGPVSYLYFPPGAGPGGASLDSLYTPIGAPSVDAVTAGRQGFDLSWHTLQYTNEPKLFYRAHLNLRGIPVGKPVRMGGTGTEWVWQVKGSGFMAGWSLPGKHGIAARRLTNAGQRTGPELRLNSRLIDHPAAVSVVGLADASFVAVWFGAVPGSPGTTVLRARRFSPSGKPLGPDFDVNTTPLESLEASAYAGFKVAAAPGGGFAVSWLGFRGTYVRWFNAAGTPLGPEVVATTPEKPGGIPQSMAFDDTGNLLLLWSFIDVGLQLRLFDPQGTPLGPPLDASSDDTTEPGGGSLVWTGDSWLVAWVAAIYPYDQSAIYVRRFAKR